MISYLLGPVYLSAKCYVTILRHDTSSISHLVLTSQFSLAKTVLFPIPCDVDSMVVKPLSILFKAAGISCQYTLCFRLGVHIRLEELVEKRGGREREIN